MGEREGVPGTAVGSVGRRTWPATALGRRAQAATLLRGQGRAAGRGRRSATRLTGGAVRQQGPVVSGGVQEAERKVRQRGGGAPTGGPTSTVSGGAV
jgi:hypothetical protein